MDTYECKPTPIKGLWEIASLDPKPFDHCRHTKQAINTGYGDPDTYSDGDPRIIELIEYLGFKKYWAGSLKPSSKLSGNWHCDGFDFCDYNYIIVMISNGPGTEFTNVPEKEARPSKVESEFQGETNKVYFMERTVTHRGPDTEGCLDRFMSRWYLQEKI